MSNSTTLRGYAVKPMTDKQWQAQSDANTLAEAAKIRTDAATPRRCERAREGRLAAVREDC